MAAQVLMNKATRGALANDFTQYNGLMVMVVTVKETELLGLINTR
jgi:hypothetical protein